MIANIRLNIFALCVILAGCSSGRVEGQSNLEWIYVNDGRLVKNLDKANLVLSISNQSGSISSWPMDIYIKSEGGENLIHGSGSIPVNGFHYQELTGFDIKPGKYSILIDSNFSNSGLGAGSVVFDVDDKVVIVVTLYCSFEDGKLVTEPRIKINVSDEIPLLF